MIKYETSGVPYLTGSIDHFDLNGETMIMIDNFESSGSTIESL
jgi:hypothetical protein